MSDADVPNGPDTPADKDFEPPDGPAGAKQGNYIVLMPRDPEWLHAYWEIPPDRVEAALDELGIGADDADLQLRLHNVTGLIEPGTGRPRLEESDHPVAINVDVSADHWYIKAGGAEQLYCVEYVVVAPDRRSVRVALSNLAATPAEHVAEPTEETWVTAAVENGKVTKTAPPAETKWVTEEEGIHEALSSVGSAQMAAESPPSESKP